MPICLEKPSIYLITAGQTTLVRSPTDKVLEPLLALVAAAVDAGVDLVQVREKQLSGRGLYYLAERAAGVTRGTNTKLLINDRADIALAVGADGVHLTTQSLPTPAIRCAFPTDFLMGVSAHSLSEAAAARDGGAHFATFGPIFDTHSKREYGPPVGLEKLSEAATALSRFPLIALGGITLKNADDALKAGACGVAAIRMFSDPRQLKSAVESIKMMENR
jgi:thiamine-phosphate pyrophosphorylase